MMQNRIIQLLKKTFLSLFGIRGHHSINTFLSLIKYLPYLSKPIRRGITFSTSLLGAQVNKHQAPRKKTPTRTHPGKSEQTTHHKHIGGRFLIYFFPLNFPCIFIFFIFLQCWDPGKDFYFQPGSLFQTPRNVLLVHLRDTWPNPDPAVENRDLLVIVTLYLVLFSELGWFF